MELGGHPGTLGRSVAAAVLIGLCGSTVGCGSQVAGGASARVEAPAERVAAMGSGGADAIAQQATEHPYRHASPDMLERQARAAMATQPCFRSADAAERHGSARCVG